MKASEAATASALDLNGRPADPFAEANTFKSPSAPKR
jgi:hypothetical protein